MHLWMCIVSFGGFHKVESMVRANGKCILENDIWKNMCDVLHWF